MQEELRANGEFQQAESVKNQLIELIHSFEQKQIQKFDDLASSKLSAMEDENENQQREFQNFWAEKMEQCEQESKKLEQSLMERQAEQRLAFEREAKAKFERGVKMSSNFIRLQSKMNQLSKLGRFEEASEVKTQLEQEHQNCIEKQSIGMEVQLKKKLESVSKIQEKELRSLVDKLNSTKNELIAHREKGLAAMLAKFRAQRALAENKINLERASKIKFLQTFDPVKNMKVSRMYIREDDLKQENLEEANRSQDK